MGSARGTLARFQPNGWTPVAGSLDEARERYEQRYRDDISFSGPCAEPPVVFASARQPEVGLTGREVGG